MEAEREVNDAVGRMTRPDFVQRLLDIVGALVVVLDREGRIVLFNRACELTTERAAATVLGQPFWDVVIAPAERAAVRDAFSRLAAGLFPSQHENEWMTASGQPRRIRWSNTCVTDDAGDVELVIATGLLQGTEVSRTDSRRSETLRPDALCSDALRSDALRSEGLRSEGMRSEGMRSEGARADVLHGDRLQEKLQESVRPPALSAEPRSTDSWLPDGRAGDALHLGAVVKPSPWRALRLLGAVSQELAQSLNSLLSLRRITRLLVPEVVDVCATFVPAAGGGVELAACTAADGLPEGELAKHLTVLAGAEADLTGVTSVLGTAWPQGSLATDWGLGSLQWMPMMAYGRTVGGMALARRRGRPPLSPEETSLLCDVALRCAIALEDARLLGHAQATVRELERVVARLQTLMRTAPVGLALLDTDLRYVELNEMLAGLHGSTPERDRGRRVTEVVPQASATVEPLMRQVLATRKPIVNREVHVEVPGVPSGPVDTLVSYYPVETRTGELVGLGAVVIDLGEQKKAERERAKLEAQLHHAQRMESIGLLAGGIAHDFNNLLVVIITAADTLRGELEGSRDAEGARAMLNDVLAAARRAAELTRDLVAFARPDPVRHEEPVAVDEWLARIVGFVRRMIRESVDIRFEGNAASAHIEIGISQLQQIFANLCLNAADAIADCGRITITSDVVALDDDALAGFPWARPGSYARILVEDTGSGMPADVQAHIFEPFFTTKQPGRGTGLGLSIVYGIVKARSGVIRVSSAPGKGTRFEVCLPLVKADDDASAFDPESERVWSRGEETVLLIEDDDLVASSVERLLVGQGYRVIAANDGEQACRLFEEHQASIALVLLDAVLPRRSGAMVLEHIAARAPDLPILVSSGYSGESFPERLLALGRVDVLHKPYGAEQLLSRVREALDGADGVSAGG